MGGMCPCFAYGLFLFYFVFRVGIILYCWIVIIPIILILITSLIRRRPPGASLKKRQSTLPQKVRSTWVPCWDPDLNLSSTSTVKSRKGWAGDKIGWVCFVAAQGLLRGVHLWIKTSLDVLSEDPAWLRRSTSTSGGRNSWCPHTVHHRALL